MFRRSFLSTVVASCSAFLFGRRKAQADTPVKIESPHPPEVRVVKRNNGTASYFCEFKNVDPQITIEQLYRNGRYVRHFVHFTSPTRPNRDKTWICRVSLPTLLHQ